MKHTLERTENLFVRQAEVVEIRVDGIRRGLRRGHRHRGGVPGPGGCGGHRHLPGGAHHRGRRVPGLRARRLQAALALTGCLRRLGVTIRRFKTGTPPRVNARSVDFSKMELQTGDEHPAPFSFSTEQPPENRAVCYLTYTNERTHEIIRANLDRSPLYNGAIESTGPRYCPSIETKIVRFADKKRHQLFVEPMGLNTGRSCTSRDFPLPARGRPWPWLPHHPQGLEQAEMTRVAYAIEYDCVDPTELTPTLEHKKGSGPLRGGPVQRFLWL